jgi:hypothetical protein
MKAATIHELNIGLSQLDKKELLSFCVRLAKFKKENKELLTYLLFEGGDIDNYIENVKKEITLSFTEMNNSNVYYIKKSVRKILRYVKKSIRFTGSKQVEAELLIHFCNAILEFTIPLSKSKPLQNLCEIQLKKIDLAISSLHPDLQYDLKKKLNQKILI